jgi:Flp pilus assembly protein TadD
MSHFVRGRYEEACRAAYRSVQANPAHSITYVQLAAALAKLGRLDEAVQQRRAFWSCSPVSATASSSPA